MVGVGEDVAEAGGDLVGQGKGDRLAFDGTFQVAVGGDDGGHPGALAGWQHGDLVAHGHRAAHHRAGETAKILVGSADPRSEEHTSELQSLMRISYAVFCLTKKN